MKSLKIKENWKNYLELVSNHHKTHQTLKLENRFVFERKNNLIYIFY